MRDVVDLRELFGERYRIGWEAEGATRREWSDEDHAWLLELQCRRGLIYPVGGEVLAAHTVQPRIGRQLARLPWVLSVRGQEETVVTFRVDDVDRILAILKPRRRRHLSDGQRTRACENLRQARQRRRELVAQNDFASAGSPPDRERSQSTGLPSGRCLAAAEPSLSHGERRTDDAAARWQQHLQEVPPDRIRIASHLDEPECS